MEINSEMLLKDLKPKNANDRNAIKSLFRFFVLNEKLSKSEQKQIDFENIKEAKTFYKELQWDLDCRYYDVINSFWITFSFAMHSKFPDDYKIAEQGNVKIYKNSYKCKNGYITKSFPEKYLRHDKKAEEHINDLCEEYPDIEKLAELCHCVADFMPCPKGFNSSKGLLSDVKDYFPLMIDKIQSCIDEDKGFEYELYGIKIKVKLETIKKWHQFFIDNREKYCLNMYYDIKEFEGEKRIEGIKFFEGQSLENPCPKETEEVKECLENMIKCIELRANQIADKKRKNI